MFRTVFNILLPVVTTGCFCLGPADYEAEESHKESYSPEYWEKMATIKVLTHEFTHKVSVCAGRADNNHGNSENWYVWGNPDTLDTVNGKAFARESRV